MTAELAQNDCSGGSPSWEGRTPKAYRTHHGQSLEKCVQWLLFGRQSVKSFFGFYLGLDLDQVQMIKVISAHAGMFEMYCGA